MTVLHTLPSPVGRLTLAADGAALTGLWLEGQRHFAAGLGADAVIGDSPVFDKTERWLSDYFSGNAPDPLALPLAPRGTDFQQRVWRSLLDIPCGETVTYGALAQALGSSPRAVGQAVGRNPISVIIPCHRVLGANDALTGYAGGLEAKRFLLTLEGVLK